MTGPPVRVETGGLVRSESGGITGTLVLHVGDMAFPDSDWSDFVVVVLSWWCDEVEKIATFGSGFHLRFMDGPFVAHGLRSDGQLVTLNLGKSGQETLHGAVSVERGALAAAIREAARLVAAECRRNGWDLPELYKLDRVVGR